MNAKLEYNNNNNNNNLREFSFRVILVFLESKSHAVRALILF
jgi:hypothetical protein